jgi:hypothetical protein
MRKCIDEGMLQTWFDGELDANKAADVASHLHDCIHCAEAVRTLEAENLIVSRGLAEFGEAVPTERLRQRVMSAAAVAAALRGRPYSAGQQLLDNVRSARGVATECHPYKAASGLRGTMVPATNRTNRSVVNSVRNLLPFLSFRVVAYASVAAAILIAGIFLAANSRKERSAPSAGKANPKEVVAPRPQTSPEPPREVVAGGPPKILASPRPKPSRKHRASDRASEPDAMSLAWIENQYQKAFPKLNEAIKAQAPLPPSLRVEYEYNLALIDNDIITTRVNAKKNPKDPLATQFMLAAYQSKIDLMNQVAQARVSEQ